MFESGDSVWFSVVWNTPSTMRGTDQLTFEWVPVDPSGSTGTIAPQRTSREAGRSSARNWYNQFTATSPGKHEIRVRNDRGDLVWRQAVTVN